MIRRRFNVDKYWKVIVYYDVDYNFFHYIVRDLYNLAHKKEDINNVYNRMSTHKAKAVTISSFKYRTSVVLFNTHNNYWDYVNSIVHEAEHIKQAMLKYYGIDDEDEEPAYTIGYLAMKMLEFYI